MNWITVKEVAEYLKLSTMMVYKLAQDGKIPSVKIGRVWRFERDSIDKWLKESRLEATAPVSQIIMFFSNKIKETFKDNLFRIVLFGSYARGDAKEGADIDILVVLKKIDNYWKSNAEIENIAYDVTFGDDRMVVLSAFLMDEKEYLTGMSPLILNVRKEGKLAA
jgi:excisionase family DNA binding protein